MNKANAPNPTIGIMVSEDELVMILQSLLKMEVPSAVPSLDHSTAELLVRPALFVSVGAVMMTRSSSPTIDIDVA
jgi:hypothetical protein